MNGRARDLRRSLDDSLKDSSSSQLEGVCNYCSQPFMKDFRKLTHHGSELKKQKRYPDPKDDSRAHYQDVIAQNEWIRGNIFNSMGDYLCFESHSRE